MHTHVRDHCAIQLQSTVIFRGSSERTPSTPGSRFLPLPLFCMRYVLSQGKGVVAGKAKLLHAAYCSRPLQLTSRLVKWLATCTGIEQCRAYGIPDSHRCSYTWRHM